MTPLSGKVAVITGASSGVGRSVALALAERGADLALVGRNAGRLRAVGELCAGKAPAVRTYRVDLLADSELRRLQRRLMCDFSGVDVLVHCAGVIALGGMAEARWEDLDRQFRLNVRAPFALTQLLLPTLTSRRGQVVFINSTAGLVATAGLSQYAATKHALRAIADSLREEVNPQGVRVLSIYLGRTATPMQARVHDEEGRPYSPERLIQPEQAAAVVVDALMMGREAEITDIRIRPTHKPGTAAPCSRKSPRRSSGLLPQGTRGLSFKSHVPSGARRYVEVVRSVHHGDQIEYGRTRPGRHAPARCAAHRGGQGGLPPRRAPPSGPLHQRAATQPGER